MRLYKNLKKRFYLKKKFEILVCKNKIFDRQQYLQLQYRQIKYICVNKIIDIYL